VTPTAKPVTTPPVAADKTPPVCSASVAKQKLGKVLKKGLKVTMNCNEAARVAASLVIPAKVVKTLTAAKALTAGKATKSTTATDTAGNRAKKRSKSLKLKR
jgi:hypothetical protein